MLNYMKLHTQNKQFSITPYFNMCIPTLVHVFEMSRFLLMQKSVSDGKFRQKKSLLFFCVWLLCFLAEAFQKVVSG
jgi:hypothetical protein